MGQISFNPLGDSDVKNKFSETEKEEVAQSIVPETVREDAGSVDGERRTDFEKQFANLNLKKPTSQRSPSQMDRQVSKQPQTLRDILGSVDSLN